MRNINVTQNVEPDAGSVAAREALLEAVLEQTAILRAGLERFRVRRLLRKSVSLTHLHVLTVLKSSGPLPMGELAQALDVSVASATGIVSRMEERGLVARTRSPEDRRVVTADIAEGGQAALDQLQGAGRERFRALLDELTAEELVLVRGGFEALNRAGAVASAEEDDDVEESGA